MPGTFSTESTLTDRYQTTVPGPVRMALHLQKREKIRYTILPDGKVLLSRADGDETGDPVLESFLKFLANDIQTKPQGLQALSPELLSRIRRLVGDIEVDLDAPLSDDEDE